MLITAVVQRGRRDGVVEAAVGAGANGGTACSSGGVGNRERLGVLALALDVDQEIVTPVERLAAYGHSAAAEKDEP